MMTADVQVGLGIVMLMIFGLSGLSFYYSMKDFIHAIIHVFKDGEL